MANWQRKLSIKDVWDCDLPIQKVAEAIAKRLKKLRPFGDDFLDEERLDLVDEFESLSTYENLTDDQFNDAMDSLYDWADTPLDEEWNGKKACWVETF